MTTGRYVSEVAESVGSSSGNDAGSGYIEGAPFVMGPCVRAVYSSGSVGDEVVVPANRGLEA
jgi:hypothetical protein